MKFIKLISLALGLLAGGVFAQEGIETADPVAESVPAAVSEEPVAQTPVEQTSASTGDSVVEPVASLVAEPAPMPVEEPAGAIVPGADTASSGGILSGLFPVKANEAIAKGHLFGGTSLSLIQGNSDDDALNVLIGDVYDAYGYTFTVEAFGGYFIKDALAVGMRAGYSRTWFDIDFALMEDLLDMKQHRKYVSNGFFVQPLLKNYMKVLDSQNFYLFNETSIKVEYSYGISQSDDGEEINKSRNRSWSIDVGINPGLCTMVLDRFAFEVSVGLLGLSSSVIEVEENGETHSEFVYNIVNFTINLLALDFSLVFFF